MNNQEIGLVVLFHLMLLAQKIVLMDFILLYLKVVVIWVKMKMIVI
jgi:hypothetical protein